MILVMKWINKACLDICVCVCVLYNKRNFAFHVEIFCGLEIFLEKKNLVCKILIKKATMFPRVFENIKFYL